MKTKYLLLVGMVVVLASCSTAYRNGQTPDDVYYSPAPAAETYVVKNNRDDRNSYSNRNSDGNYMQQREIRQGIRDSRYRSSISLSMGYGGYSSFGYNPFNYNPYGFNSYGYNPYGYNSYFGYNKGYNDPFGYNPYYNYNPYYPSYGYNPNYHNGYYPPTNYYPVPGKSSSNRGARQYNLGSYTPPSTTPRGSTPTKNGIFRPVPIAPVRTFENRTSPTNPVRQEKTGVGNVIRRVFTPSNDKRNTPPATRRVEKSNNPPVRRFDPPVRRSEPPVRRNNTPPVRNNTPPVRSNNTPPVRSTNNPPARTFDPSPSVSSTPAPSASSSSTPARESSSTPVRTFRNN